MLAYGLTPLAEQDLKEIARYTLKEWGKKQSIRYARLLEDHFHGIANRTVTSRTVFEQFPDVYVTRCKHHYIFYLYQNGKRPPYYCGSPRTNGYANPDRETFRVNTLRVKHSLLTSA